MPDRDRQVQNGPVAAGHDDAELVAALVRGDEVAFVALVDRYHASMIRVASRFVPSPAVAEEVAQEAWVGLLRGIEGFGGRSSLKTWHFTILLNQARRRGAAEHRTIPFSALAGDRDDEASPSVDSERFVPLGHPDAGHWISELPAWEPSAEDMLMSWEINALIRRTVDALPPAWPWSSPCVTSRGGAPRRSVTSWESRTPTSECGSTGRGPAPEANSSGI